MKKLILTHEHPDVCPCGGAGTFIKELSTLSNSRDCITVYLKTRPSNYVGDLVFSEEFLATDTEMPLPDYALAVVQKILSSPEGVGISQILCPDSPVIATRIIEARDLGIIPKKIKIYLICHGGLTSLEYAGNCWIEPRRFSELAQDRLCYEKADHLFFVSNYHRKLLLSHGTEIASSYSTSLLCFSHNQFHNYCSNPISENIKQLVYIGKQNREKGFLDFLSILKLLSNSSIHFDKTFFFGLKRGDLESKFAALIYRKSYQYKNLSRKELLEFISKNSHDTLFILPYPGDNSPYAIYELLALGAQFLAYQAGGVEEIIPKDFWSSTLTNATPEGMQEGIERYLALDVAQREQLIQNRRSAFQASIDSANNFWNESLKDEHVEDAPQPNPTSVALEEIQSLTFETFSIEKLQKISSTFVLINSITDSIKNDFIKNAVNALISAPNISAVTSYAEIKTKEGGDSHSMQRPILNSIFTLWARPDFATCSAVYRTSDLISAFQSELAYSNANYAPYVQLMAQGYRVAVLPQSLREIGLTPKPKGRSASLELAKTFKGLKLFDLIRIRSLQELAQASVFENFFLQRLEHLVKIILSLHKLRENPLVRITNAEPPRNLLKIKSDT